MEGGVVRKYYEAWQDYCFAIYVEITTTISNITIKHPDHSRNFFETKKRNAAVNDYNTQ